MNDPVVHGGQEVGTAADGDHREPEPGMAAALVTVALLFLGVFLAIPVAPIVAEAAGSAGDAGLVTGVFSAATVAMQLFMPRLLRSPHASRALVWSLVVMAAPNIVFVLAPDNVPGLLAASALRGIGFGVGSVLSSLVITGRASPARMGTVLGWYGIAATVPGVLGPSGGLFLEASFGFRWPFILAMVVCLAGVVPARLAARGPLPAGRRRDVPGLLRTRAMLLPTLVSLLGAIMYGGVLSFVPVALTGMGWESASVFFLVSGLVRAATRYGTGRLADVHDPAGLLVWGPAMAAGGAILLATEATAPGLVLSAILFGAGIGVIQNLVYLVMLARVDRGRYGAVATIWNLSIDGGVAVGALMLGLVAEVASVGVVFWLLPIFAALAIPTALGDWLIERRDGAPLQVE
jgi:MFS family permease